MKVICGLKNLKKNIKRSALTIGVFDGVHIGHREVIREVVREAKGIGAKSVVLTFDRHPSKVLDPKTRIPSLVSLQHRIRLIKSLGVDYLIILKFTKRLARLSAERFISNILIDILGMRKLYVGEDFYFGKGAKTDVKGLATLAKRLNFRLKVISPVKAGAHVISSSLIRHLIVKGRIDRAARFLGRPVSILGTVVRGSERGRILGFPTANINPHHEAIPPSGVYAVRVIYKNRRLKGVLNIGKRPTFERSKESTEPTVEVHIFGFNRRIYGDDIEVIFAKKLRDERKFGNRASLIAEINRDVRKAKSILV